MTPTTINSASTLNVRATLSTAVPANGRLVVTLPSSMSVSTSTILSCTFSEPVSVVVSNCAFSGNVITATLGSTQLPANFFQIDISSVVNPPSTTTTGSFVFETQQSTGTVIDTQTSNIVLTATAGTMASSTLTPASDVVGATTTLTVSMTTTNTVLAGGKVKVTFPKWNVNAVITSEIQSMVQTGFVVAAVSNLNSASLVAAFASDVLTISNGISTNIPAGSVISFSVTNFKNPITTSVFSGFTITTTDSSDGTIDTGSAQMQIGTASTVYSTTFGVGSGSTTIVQEKAVFRLQFRVPVPLNSGCIMEVTFPSDFTLSGADLTNVRGLGLFGGARVLTGSLNVGNNTYTITDGCSTYVSQDIDAILDFTSIENPDSIKTTDSVQIFIKDSTQFPISQLTSGITYTATTGTLTGVTLTPENTIVSATTAITLRFLPAHSLIADDSRIEIILPTDVSITEQSNPSTCSVSDLQFISPTVQCTVIGNTITLLDPFSVTYLPTSTEVLGFKIQGMVMPSSTRTTGAVVITTKIGTTTFSSVDTVSNSNLFTAVVGSMTEFSATPSVLSAYSTTTYTFSFKPQHVILQNGFVTVDIPAQVSIPNTATAASSCAIITGFQNSITCSISGSKITVSNGFRTSNVAASTQISFSIGGIRNPVSTSTSSSFSFTTLDSNSFSIDVRSSGITVTMTSVSNLTRAALSIGSTVNGATTTYTFTFIAQSPLTDGDRMYIKVPDSITAPVSPTCAGISKLASSLTCNTLNKELFITLSFSSGSTLDAGEEFSFSITNFINPTSTKPTSALTFQAQDSTGSLINDSPSSLSVSVTTDTAASVATASVSNENKDASQSTALYLNITTVHQIPLNGAIIITYPVEVAPFDSSVTAITCSLNIASSPTCTHNSATRTITISNIVTTTPLVAGSQVEITLNEMKNPSTASSTNSFRIITYEVSSGVFYAIDSVTSGLTIASNCNYPCKTCSGTNSSDCLSCLNDATGTTLLLQTSTTSGVSTTTCVSSCDTDYVNINNVCQPCLEN